jgi:hypothetical protein
MQGPDKLPHPTNLKLSIAMQEQSFVVESLWSLNRCSREDCIASGVLISDFSEVVYLAVANVKQKPEDSRKCS